MMEPFTVAFLGHRYIASPKQAEAQLDRFIEKLEQKYECMEFLVGRNGDFDRYAASAVNKAKKKGREDSIFLVLVLPYMTAEYQNNVAFFEDYYDEIELCQDSEKVHYKSAIQVRNRAMVDRADLILCWVDHKSGGAYQTLRYAQKQKKTIINLAE